MNPRIAALGHEIRRLEEELEVEFARRRTEFAYTVRDRAVRFEERVLHSDTDVGCEGITQCGARCVAQTDCVQYRDLFEGHPTARSGLLQTCLNGCFGWH